MTQRSPISIRLDRFEGPLDLLLHLIQSNELDVSKISIGRITDQYLSFIQFMLEQDFDVASDFLLMAATLVYWKSKALLPKDPSEQAQADGLEDHLPTPEDLIRQLLEHQRFLAAGDDLAQFPRLHEDVFVRPNDKPAIERVWKEMNLSDLTLTYQDILTRARKRKHILKKETVSIGEKILDFNSRLEIGKLTELTALMSMAPSRDEQVVTFLAALEVTRRRKMKVYQQLTYDPIFVELIEQITQIEINLAAAEFEKSTPLVSSSSEPQLQIGESLV